LTGSEYPELKYLYRHVREPVATKWKNLGIELLEEKDLKKLEIIKANNAANAVERC